MLKTNSQGLFVSLGNPAPMTNCQILPKCLVSMPWLGALLCAERHVPLPVPAQGCPRAAESLKLIL